MGFSSMDDFLNKVTVLGQFWRQDWNKLSNAAGVHVAGEWHAMFAGQGNPTVGLLTGGTNLSFQELTDQSAGAILNGGAVSPSTKHILNASAVSAAATTMPAVAQLVDLLGFYPVSTVTATGNQALINAIPFTVVFGTGVFTTTGYDIASLSRVRVSNAGGTLPTGLVAATDYWTIRQSASTSLLATSLANAIAGTSLSVSSNGSGTNTITAVLPRYFGGAGVQAMVVANGTLGAGTPNIQINYTNPLGTAGHVTPATLPVGKTGAFAGHIVYSGTGAGKYGPAMPLAAGDTGVQSVQQFNLSATYTSGSLAVVLFRPLLTLPMTTVGVAAERDLMNQLPSLPQVFDNACLAWNLYAGAATPTSSAFYGAIDFGWG